MKKLFILLFSIFTFLLFNNQVKAESSDISFELISVERSAYVDMYTICASKSGYALGWVGNDSYLIINDDIRIKATSTMSSSNYNSFVIRDNSKQLNAPIESVKFSNVLKLNSNDLPTGNLSGNPTYTVKYSDAEMTGMAYGFVYNQDSYTSVNISGSSNNTTSNSFQIKDYLPYISIGIMIVYFLFSLIIMRLSIVKMSKNKVLSYNENKKPSIPRAILYVIMVLLWFGLFAFNGISNVKIPLLIIHVFEGFALFVLLFIISGAMFKKAVNKKMKSIDNLKKGMTREEVRNILEFELLDNDTFKVYRPYLNGSENLLYHLTFDESGKLIDVKYDSHKKWTEIRQM